MKLAVVGSRTFNDYDKVIYTLDKFRDKITVIISGGAKGADTLAERYANQNGIKTVIYYPDWDSHGRSAGFIRNADIVKSSDAVIAFWDGRSKGTKHTIDYAKRLNKPVLIVEV